MEWIKVSERLPEVGVKVLIKIEFRSDIEGFNVESAELRNDGLWVGCWYDTYGKEDSCYKVTAWSNLPVDK